MSSRFMKCGLNKARALTFAQHLALVLHKLVTVGVVRSGYIEHQTVVINGDLNQYLAKSSATLVNQSLHLRRVSVSDVDHFVTNKGLQVLNKIIQELIGDVL
jgi:predicted naringenin-chalcone synthase